MSNDDNVYIKLELNKDKNSGKIDIITRFDNNAPNVIIENNEYFWMPTFEEKDFLNEAFLIINSNNKNSYSKSEDSFSSKKEPIEEKFEDNYVDAKENIKKEIITEQTKTDIKEDTRDIENKKDSKPAVFEVTNKDGERVDAKQEAKDDDSKDNKDLDEAVIVEADSQAIENALKKHKKKNDEDDDSIVEADEKTIIDKVLQQKKKGKWKK